MGADYREIFIPKVNCRIECLTDRRRRLSQGIEYRLEIESRATNRFENVSSCGLLFSRFVKFAPKPHDLGFLAGSRRTAMAHSVWAFRLATSRLSRFAACFGELSHRHPKAQDYAELKGLQQGLEAGEMGFNDQFALQKS
jgi:hypothetical protein